MAPQAHDETMTTARRSRAVHRNSNSTLRKQARVLGDDVRKLARAAGDSAFESLDPIQEFVREKPLQSLLIAAGVGAVFSMVFLRR